MQFLRFVLILPQFYWVDNDSLWQMIRNLCYIEAFGRDLEAVGRSSVCCCRHTNFHWIQMPLHARTYMLKFVLSIWQDKHGAVRHCKIWSAKYNHWLRIRWTDTIRSYLTGVRQYSFSPLSMVFIFNAITE